MSWSLLLPDNLRLVFITDEHLEGVLEESRPEVVMDGLHFCTHAVGPNCPGLLSTSFNSSTVLSSLSDPSIFSAMVAIASFIAPFFLPFFLGASVPDVPGLVPVD